MPLFIKDGTNLLCSIIAYIFVSLWTTLMGRYISTFIGIGREEWEPPPTSWEITNNYYTITLQLSQQYCAGQEER